MFRYKYAAFIALLLSRRNCLLMCHFYLNDDSGATALTRFFLHLCARETRGIVGHVVGGCAERWVLHRQQNLRRGGRRQ